MMSQAKLFNFITMENMYHILPIVKNNQKLMGIIKSKLKKDVDQNNEMIISEIKKEILSFDENRYKYYESHVLALMEIL